MSPIGGEGVPGQPVNWLELEWRHVVGLPSGFKENLNESEDTMVIETSCCSSDLANLILTVRSTFSTDLRLLCQCALAASLVTPGRITPVRFTPGSDHFSSTHYRADCPIWITPGQVTLVQIPHAHIIPGQITPLHITRITPGLITPACYRPAPSDAQTQEEIVERNKVRALTAQR